MKIRTASRSDVPQLVGLFAEMERHYGAPDVITPDVIETRLQAWFDGTTDTTFLVAEDAGRIVGHASLAPLFPAAGAQVALFIKDVFVNQAARGKGVGRAFIQACAAEAKKRGAPRLELTVDHDNEGAARLYKQLGAVDTKKSYFRWDGQRLADLAKGRHDG